VCYPRIDNAQIDWTQDFVLVLYGFTILQYVTRHNSDPDLCFANSQASAQRTGYAAYGDDIAIKFLYLKSMWRSGARARG
jgi:hypothetical protein